MDRPPATIVIWLVAGVIALFGCLRLFGDGGERPAAPVRLAGGSGGTLAGPGRTHGGAGRSRVVVHVAGAVRRPGLYRIAQGARVATALERAGGPSRRAELNAVNLAAHVQDGQQIVVPERGGTFGVGSAASTAKSSLGSASEQQLEELDGIGPELAGRIVEYRTAHGGFRSVDELAEVEGIGEQRLASLRKALQP
ncbi:MAG TPA: ComEA family DNA-binding protein [Thermoleophilaceae bacterium]